jgi:hypothetical protein
MNAKECMLGITIPGLFSLGQRGVGTVVVTSPQTFLILLWKSHCTSEHFKGRLAFSGTCHTPVS